MWHPLATYSTLKVGNNRIVFSNKCLYRDIATSRRLEPFSSTCKNKYMIGFSPIGCWTQGQSLNVYIFFTEIELFQCRLRHKAGMRQKKGKIGDRVGQTGFRKGAILVAGMATKL